MKRSLLKVTVAAVVPGLIHVAAFAQAVKPARPVLTRPVEVKPTTPVATPGAQTAKGGLNLALPSTNVNNQAPSCDLNASAEKIAQGTGRDAGLVKKLIQNGVMVVDGATCGTQIANLPEAARRNLIDEQSCALDLGVTNEQDPARRDSNFYAPCLGKALAANDNSTNVSSTELQERVSQIRSHCGYNK